MPESRPLSETPKEHMSDVDRVRDCLCDARERSVMYAQAAMESINNGVREFFLAMHGEETHNQEVLLSFLHTRGHYPTQMVTREQMTALRKHYQTQHDQMKLTDPPSFRRYHTADPTLPPLSSEKPEAFDYKAQH